MTDHGGRWRLYLMGGIRSERILRQELLGGRGGVFGTAQRRYDGEAVGAAGHDFAGIGQRDTADGDRRQRA